MANYLYNGYELPELPGWNRQEYPYAVILKIHDANHGDVIIGDTFELYAMDKKGYAGTGTLYVGGVPSTNNPSYSGIIITPSYDATLGSIDDNIRYALWSCPRNTANWTLDSENNLMHYIGASETEAFLGREYEIIWSNYDILDESGNVYLAASEPVSSEPVAPSDPLKDWLIGLALELARETRPISLKDVFDDEWPIQWKHPDIETNATKSGQSVKISNIIIPESDYANLVLDIKKNGVTTTYRYSETTQSYAAVDYIKLYNSEQDADLTLFNVKKLGSVFPKTGLYVGRHDPCECTLTKGGA